MPAYQLLRNSNWGVGEASCSPRGTERLAVSESAHGSRFQVLAGNACEGACLSLSLPIDPTVRLLLATVRVGQARAPEAQPEPG